ncbi:hypothetical protein GUJ93_ZPchr0002g24112 [Zizania palustris]|uniref:Uncharacterized protein n=1 Tax=Zizania palustris TaxID=103762 RepID=A0A8J5S2J2_ZIZPA|nr:hypothetical protein GUJ93_ZPchr0002g24112 [Zizania palustris]
MGSRVDSWWGGEAWPVAGGPSVRPSGAPVRVPARAHGAPGFVPFLSTPRASAAARARPVRGASLRTIDPATALAPLTFPLAMVVIW